MLTLVICISTASHIEILVLSTTCGLIFPLKYFTRKKMNVFIKVASLLMLLFKTYVAHTNFPIKMKLLQFPIDDERLNLFLSESHSYCLNIVLMSLRWLEHTERLKPWTVYLYPFLKTSMIPKANISGPCKWVLRPESTKTWESLSPLHSWPSSCLERVTPYQGKLLQRCWLN